MISCDKFVWVCVMSALAMLAGCASKEPELSKGESHGPREPNEYTTPTIYWEWLLTTLDGAPLKGGRTPSLTIWPDGRITGGGGVNAYSTAADTAKLDAGEFSIAPIVATKMAGPDIPMQEEQEFFDALTGATSLQLDDNSLVLRSGTRDVARFRPARLRPISKEEQDRRLEELVKHLKEAQANKSP